MTEHKIVFLCNWGESPKELLNRYKKQTPNKSGKWGNLKGVSSIGEADYYIVLDDYINELPQDKTIFICREPDFIKNYRNRYKNSIKWEDTNCGITWWINKTYDELKNLPYPVKNKKISCVASSKHPHRSNYIKQLIKDNPNIDLYGRGHNAQYYGDSYKGPLNYDGKCKLKGIAPYEYSVTMENSQQNNYFTEKLADTILSWTVPLYWGCPNIDLFFPEESYYNIDINQNLSPEQLEFIVNKPINIEALSEARNLILDKYNIWEVINTKIKTL